MSQVPEQGYPATVPRDGWDARLNYKPLGYGKVNNQTSGVQANFCQQSHPWTNAPSSPGSSSDYPTSHHFPAGYNQSTFVLPSRELKPSSSQHQVPFYEYFGPTDYRRYAPIAPVGHRHAMANPSGSSYGYEGEQEGHAIRQYMATHDSTSFVPRARMETSYPQHSDYASSSYPTHFSQTGTVLIPAFGAVNNNAAATSYPTSAEQSSAQPSSSRPTPSQSAPPPPPPTAAASKTAAKPRRRSTKKPAAPKAKKTPVRKPRRPREDRIPTILQWEPMPIESEMTLWCEGDRIRPVIMVSCTKNLWDEGLSAPVTYRRNYVTIDSRYTLPIPVSADSHKYADGFNGKKLFVRDGRGVVLPVNAIGLRLHSVVDQYGGKDQPLTQHTAKRDKGHEGNFWERCVLPDQSGTLTRTPHDAARPECPDLKFQLAGYHGPSADNGVQTDLSWHRVQFKAATANNGSRRATQQYYHFLVSMVVDVSDHLNTDGEPNPLPDFGKPPKGPRTHRGKWLVIESRLSHRVIARGRSPNHYESSSTSTANASNGGGGGPSNEGGSNDGNGPEDDEDEGPEPDDEGTAPSGDRNNGGRSVLAAQSHNNRVGKYQQQQRLTQQPSAHQAAAMENQLREQQEWHQRQAQPQYQYQEQPQMQLQGHSQGQDEQWMQMQQQQMQRLQQVEYEYAPLPMAPMTFIAANQTVPAADVNNITTAFQQASMAEQNSMPQHTSEAQYTAEAQYTSEEQYTSEARYTPLPEHISEAQYTSMPEHTSSSVPYDGTYFQDDGVQHPSLIKDETHSVSLSPTLSLPQPTEPGMVVDGFGNYVCASEAGPSSSEKSRQQAYTAAAFEHSELLEDSAWCSGEYAGFDAFAEQLDL